MAPPLPLSSMEEVLLMEMLSQSTLSPADVWSSQIVRVPVRVMLYRQAMAENGQGDRPQPLGVALPFGHVCYQQ